MEFPSTKLSPAIVPPISTGTLTSQPGRPFPTGKDRYQLPWVEKCKIREEMMDDFRDSHVCIVLFRSISLWSVNQFSQPPVLCALISKTIRDLTSAYPELPYHHHLLSIHKHLKHLVPTGPCGAHPTLLFPNTHHSYGHHQPPSPGLPCTFTSAFLPPATSKKS